MFNNRTTTIIKREIREQVFSKKFLIMTLSFPLIMSLVIALQLFIATFDHDSQSRLLVLTESQTVQSLIREQFADSDFNDDERFTVQYELASGESALKNGR